MKVLEAINKVKTCNHKISSRFVFNLANVIGYEVEIEDSQIEKIHIYLSSGKERHLDHYAWDKEVLIEVLDKLDSHFLPPIPSDEIDFKPDKIDFYYC